ncbi:MAG: sortase [Candidatus Dormibacteria bacterium]
MSDRHRIRMDLRDISASLPEVPRVDVERLRTTGEVSGRAYRRGVSVTRLAGAALMLIGAVYTGVSFLPVLQRGQSDNRERIAWQEAVAAPLPAGASATDKPAVTAKDKPAAATVLPNGVFALLRLPSVQESVVMGDGNWDVLQHRGAVHWHDSPTPGADGNVVVAFHREPLFKDVNMLKVGNYFEIQDRMGKTYRYRVSRVHTVRKGPQGWDTSDLDPVHTGKVATLVTCDPWYQDYQRLMIRGELV